MKNKNYFAALFIPVLFFNFFIIANLAQAQSPADSITDKVICGYQGWFNCYGDGSAVARWAHWSGGQYQSNNGFPEPGHLSFEVYPDITGYAASDLFQTGFANLGDGQAAKLFSSYPPAVIDTHFARMQKNGIDGVALQRFIGETFDGVFKKHRDSVSVRVKRSAEKYGRIFYLMYDISGLDATKFDSIKTDWQNHMIGKLHLTSSPMYAKQNSKPVVCLWGFGFTDRPGSATECLDVINWFKTQGCYVIGGVPTNWRTCTSDSKAGFENVYKAYDMISPWSVGRFADNTGANNFKTNYLIPDKAYCQTYGMKYQPVIFPGFSWSNWNGGAQNQIARNKGEFMWNQFYNIQQLGIPNMYVAMFDEYDEGTNILNMADSYYMIPTNQYFLTTSADGAYLSSDFYLRLVGKATKVIRGIDPITTNVTIPYSEGPIYFRTSVEQKYDAMPNWVDSPDPSVTVTNVIGYNGTGNPECSATQETPKIGTYSLRYSGRDNSASASFCYFRVFDVNIPVYSNTQLNFWTYPQNDLARYVSVDLVLSDGSKLSTSGALDINGLSMHPSQARGVINTWTENTCMIGQWLNGKTIQRILVAYDHAPETGNFRGFVDDISIKKGAIISGIKNANGTDIQLVLYPNPVTHKKVLIDLSGVYEKDLVISIADMQGKLMLEKTADPAQAFELSTDTLQSGIYIISVRGKNILITQKLIIL